MPRQLRPQLTPDEIVAYLKRTSQPTALVEGCDDKVVYRHLESRLDDLDIDCLDCGGRPALLSVFDRRGEFADSPVIFIADKDMWHFTGIPSDYASGIIFTQGYSIENDLYCRDFFESLLDPDEKRDFDCLIGSLSRWQAFHVVAFTASGSCKCDYHLNQIAPPPGTSLCSRHLSSISFSEPPDELVSLIGKSYSLSLRGKTLFQAILRFLSSSSRASKYSKANLLELGAKIPNDCIDRICNEIRSAALSLVSAV